MSITRTAKTRASRRLVIGVLLAASACGFLAGCASWPQAPTYTDAELKASCERRGGWWRGDLIAGYCEFQTAHQSP